jgi:hypothetical protein
MATLCLTGADRPDDASDASASACAAPALRAWLDGNWGLLFSHPQDFQERGFESDRWLAVMREEFEGCGVRPLALTGRAGECARRDLSWVSAMTGDWRVINLQPAIPAQASADEVVDLNARLLQADITQLTARFVLIVDAGLRRRGLLRYDAGGTGVSPLDLLASIHAMRRSPSRTRASSIPPATKNTISTSTERRWLPLSSATMPIAAGPSTAANFASML